MNEPVIHKVNPIIGGGIAPPAPSLAPGALDNARRGAMHELAGEYDAYLQAGGRAPFRVWLGEQVNAFLINNPVQPRSDQIDSEGLGPIPWVLFGWAVWAEGIVKAAIKEVLGDAVEYVIENAVRVQAPVPPDPPATPVDMSPPAGVNEPQAESPADAGAEDAGAAAGAAGAAAAGIAAAGIDPAAEAAAAAAAGAAAGAAGDGGGGGGGGGGGDDGHKLPIEEEE